MLVHSYKFLILTVISLLAVTFVAQQALAYGGSPEVSSSNKFTVKTTIDKTVYATGDTIKISGSVNKYVKNKVLQVTIFTAQSKLILIKAISVTPDGKFSDIVSVDKKLPAGKYILKSQYGTSKAIISKLLFSVQVNVESVPLAMKHGMYPYSTNRDTAYNRGYELFGTNINGTGKTIVGVNDKNNTLYTFKNPEMAKKFSESSNYPPLVKPFGFDKYVPFDGTKHYPKK